MLLKKRINCYSSFQNKEFIYAYVFLHNLKKALSNKNILISESILNFCGNKLSLDLFLFYKTKKLLSYKKKIKKSSSLIKARNKVFESSKIIWKKSQFGLNKTLSLAVLRISNLNSFITAKYSTDLKKLYFLSKKFLFSIFSRRFNLLIDFIKMAILFSLGKTTDLAFLIVIGQLFKPLQKKNHTKFFFWLKSIFSFLLAKNYVYGLKFVINGKLKGKTRSSTLKMSVGSVPIQSLNKKITFSKVHVYTILGAFGFKLWVNK